MTYLTVAAALSGAALALWLLLRGVGNALACLAPETDKDRQWP